jgi:NAD(P)-dependent dehydrogenase (short-subunit alcohol dehydrogenase family)
MHTILSFLVLFLNAVFEIRRILLKKKANIVPSKSVVAITGCDSGFGEMAAIQLSKLGFLVVAGCLTEKGVTNIRDKVTHTVILDVTKEKDIQTFVNETEKICSSRNAKLWAILNNAGVADGGALDWVPMRTYRFIFEVNFFGVVAVTKAFLPLLKRNKDSRIINLSSLAGLFSSPMMTAYASSKHAVEGFAKGLRAELKPWSINVSNINPGFMR